MPHVKHATPIGVDDLQDFSEFLQRTLGAQPKPLAKNEFLRFTVGQSKQFYIVYSKNHGRKIGAYQPQSVLHRWMQDFAKWRATGQPLSEVVTVPECQSIQKKLWLSRTSHRSKFAQWLEYNGAEIHMTNPKKGELLVFAWFREGRETQTVSRVWLTHQEEIVFSPEIVHLIVACQKNHMLQLGGAKRRKTVSNAKISALISRDGHACIYCGKTAEQARVLTIEHFIPISHGGTNHLDNMAFACKPCNMRVGNLSIAEKIKIRDQIRSGKHA